MLQHPRKLVELPVWFLLYLPKKVLTSVWCCLARCHLKAESICPPHLLPITAVGLYLAREYQTVVLALCLGLRYLWLALVSRLAGGTVGLRQKGRC